MDGGNKGQASIEMIVTIGIILIIFIICLIFSQTKIKESNEYTMLLDAKRVCNSVADNIDTIAEQGPGYYRYISIPNTIRGGYDYRMVTYSKFVQIEWDNPTYSPWSTQIITQNVNFCCNGVCNGTDKDDTAEGTKDKLSKGLYLKNKVFNEGGKIFVTCHMPELRFFEETFLPTGAEDGENITARIDVVNFGPVDASNFGIRFTHVESGIQNTFPVNLLKADTTMIARADFNITACGKTCGNYTIELDFDNNVSESIESNNNLTLEVACI
ncbi:MAG: hypothetical protein B6U72_02820 [Candidatus Altiarchaeales archaeon ex4484_2]|nr:MAG: hypothetical protein B6U72_02820 [Candidatus Altiarchaeales archaeon ex4484_2]